MPILVNGEVRKASVSNARGQIMVGTAHLVLIWCAIVARILHSWTLTVRMGTKMYGKAKSAWREIIN